MRPHVRLAPRDPDELHRAATPLELFLDLAFVVAVAQAASSLHHGLVDGHAGDALLGFPLVFFAIWWAWMNFAWFASAYDNDDALYRLAVFVQMTGVLVLAAGIPRAFDERDLEVITVGYVVMRLALVAQWLRAARSHRSGRQTALRYAAGVTAVQIGWLLRLLVPERWYVVTFLVLAVAELAVPVWAETAGRTPWHPGHMVERYGLFTIIVLGESVLAATIAAQAALDAESSFADLAAVVIGGLLLAFAMWWIYFDLPSERLVERARREFEQRVAAPFAWGYGHYLVFGSVAAAGAGVAVAIDRAAGHVTLSDTQAGLAVTVPVAVFVLAVWVLHAPAKSPGPMRSIVPPVAVALVLASSATPEPVLVAGLVLTALVVIGVVLRPRPAAAAERVRT
ncbi:MAG: low temperature requirement protein A [Acidimicrobiia bacterium]